MGLGRRTTLALALAAAAASALPASTATASAAWPEDIAWVPVVVAGEPLADGAGDGGFFGTRTDIVGDSDHPAAYVSADPRTAGDQAVMRFRLRLDGSPVRQGEIESGQWIVQLSTNEDPNAYDVAIVVRGGGAQIIDILANTDRQCCPNDLPEERVGSSELVLGVTARVTQAESSFSDDPDYFLDWAIPIDGGAFTLPGDPGPVRFLFGTSVSYSGVLGGGDTAGVQDGEASWELDGSDLYVRSLADGTLIRETTSPTVGMDAPPAFVLGDATLSWSGADPDSGIAGWDLRHRTARWDGGLGVETALLTRTTLTGVRRSLPIGSTACYSVRSVNGAHLPSAWTAPRCVARPLDQEALRASGGWETDRHAAYWGGSARVTDARGATLALAGVRARRLALVATTCPSCGKVEVIHDGVSRGVISLRSSRTRHRQILALPPFTARTGKLQLRVVTGGRAIRVDGVGISAG